MVVGFLSIYLWNRMPITFGFDYHNITRRPTLYYKGCQCSSVTTMMWGRYVGFFCDYNDVRQIGGFLLELCNNVRKTSGFLLELCNDVRKTSGFLLGLQWFAEDRWFSSGTAMRQIGGFRLELCNDVRQIGGFRLELCNDVR
jgi:hypothetical protein